MSASSIGSSTSFYGASGDSGGLSGGSSALTQSILGAVSLAGENIALAMRPAPLVTQPIHAPITSPTPALASISVGASHWIVIAILVVVAFFAYREL